MDHEKGITNARARYFDPESVSFFRSSANRRKRQTYWAGFLSGVLASKRLEDEEIPSLIAEASHFAEFFNDPDARDLSEDLNHLCFESREDVLEQIQEIINSTMSTVMSEQQIESIDEVNEFLGFCAGIACDGRLHPKEIDAIVTRFNESEVIEQHPIFENLKYSVFRSMQDGKLTEAEINEILEWLVKLTGDGYSDTGISSIGKVIDLPQMIVEANNINFAQSCFVLTGPLRMGPRSYIVSSIEKCGGIFHANISKKTQYLIVAGNASPDWAATHYGRKIEKVLEYRSKGVKISFVSEYAFEEALRSMLKSADQH
ncbi:BRCT domain-containing protein [Sandaracinobacteroides saxicola]|uniref:BRCT domain-containing protein n=1 Tax=Sandaracinobacteroides saxicola TaxID=2759707 RepID=A0A7G5IGE7_9SPHN|nr:BRCT domain-containing protein [Sandaracinobacteroides saxicola]QMW22439.1 BRCT domain-containing protein [Sandaracinobacteroides saxicola]